MNIRDREARERTVMPRIGYELAAVAMASRLARWPRSAGERR
jgi:hypothetical protein